MFAALLGPALSFGSSLISGLGAQQSAKKQQKLQAAYEYQNYLQQVEDNRANRDWFIENQADRYDQGALIKQAWNPINMASHADAAGFNPVTWGGMMSPTYGAMLQLAEGLQTPGLWQQQSYMQNAPTAQVPSTMEAVGGALQAGVNTFLSDRRVSQSQDFQREMLQQQISAIQRNGGRPTSDMGVPAAQRTFFGSGQLPYAVTAGATRTARPTGELGFSDWKPGDVDVTSPYGYGVRANPNVADAGAVTQRLGESELLETGVAGYNLAQDLSWLYFGRTVGGGAKQGWRTLFGYSDYNDGARGTSWGRPDASYNPGQFPGFGYSTGGRF